MGWYLTGQCIWYIILVTQRTGLSFSQALGGEGPAVSLALACYGFLGALYPFALVSYHIYLVCSGQNTHEYVIPSSIKKLTQLRNKSFQPRERDRPFNRGGSFRNLFGILCWPKSITYVAFFTGNC